MSGDNRPRMVLIKNLSASTSEDHVQHLCNVVGPVAVSIALVTVIY